MRLVMTTGKTLDGNTDAENAPLMGRLTVPRRCTLLFGGYVRAMSRAGLNGNDASHKEVKCTELDIPVVLQCMEFVPSKEDIIDLNVLIDCFVHHISMTEAQYLG